MRRKKLLGIILFTIIFIGIITLSNNLNKIRFTLSLMELYRNNNIANDSNTPLDNIVVENPLEKFVEQEDIVDIEVDNEDNSEIIQENTYEHEDNIKSNDEIVDLDDNDSFSETQLPNDKNKISLNKIITNYNHKFKSLEDELQKSLLSLIESAFIEYSSGIYSDTDLANRYLEEGTNLEASTDAKFYTLLNELENDLDRNTYSTDLIASIEDYYILLKEQIKLDIINKGFELVKR